ncbi:BON domain-containing protein [Pendulispora brunnea]|uniref:BON domain-containing protein n=1 Tax=Pendulispora brunnea TaxID=2905690 RepID=A0ABZ2KH82_9BACT
MRELANEQQEATLRQINEALQRQPELRSSEIRFEVDGDAVTLLGSVDDIWMASAIERTVAAVPGVTRVKNCLEIRAELGSEAQAKQTEFGNAEVARSAVGDGDNTLWSR